MDVKTAEIILESPLDLDQNFVNDGLDSALITKREQIAMECLQGLMNIYNSPELAKAVDTMAQQKGITVETALADSAVVQADALLKRLDADT